MRARKKKRATPKEDSAVCEKTMEKSRKQEKTIEAEEQRCTGSRKKEKKTTKKNAY
jgi:hypothetical protein